MKNGPAIEQRLAALEREVFILKEANQLRAMADQDRLAAESRTDDFAMTMERVLRAACQIFDVTRRDLWSRHKNEDVCWARHGAIALTMELTGARQTLVARAFRRDHGTIMNSVKKMTDYNKRAPVRLQKKLEQLRRELQGNQ